MHPGPRRCRSGAQVHSLHWRTVRIDGKYRPANDLSKYLRPAGDIATHQIGIVPLKICSARDAPCENQITEPRRESLDLRFDVMRYVKSRPVWHMTVRPRSMLSRRR